VCIVVEARNYGAAIALAAPERAVLLTAAGDDWPTIQKRVNRLREYLQRQKLAGQWVWHVEVNPSGDGHHVHAWQWGAARLTEHDLRSAAVRAGLGHMVGLSSVSTPVGLSGEGLLGATAMSYGMKSVMGEPRGDSLTAEQESYLSVNGQRLAHASHGFWRDQRGRRLRGRKEAVRVALRGRTVGAPDQWALMTRRAAASTLALPAAEARGPAGPASP
jgi:hypothetical protein